MNTPVQLLSFADAAGAWLLTYLLHSTALLVPALLLGRWLGAKRLALQESVVRVALVGGLLTASLQVGLGWEAATGSLPYPSARSAVAASATPDATVVSPERREARPATDRKTARETSAVVTSTDLQAAASRRGTLLALAVGLWSATGIFLLMRLGVLALRLGRSLQGRSELQDGRVFKLFWRLLAVADVDKPTHLTRSSRLEVPIALGVGRREICLPDRVVEELPQEQQETVLAHELAHLERRDPAWLLFARVLESALFVQPLNRLARRKLQVIAEYRCDDWAAEYTGRPLTLAKCLTAVATWTADRRAAALAPTMAGRPSGLGQRVRRLLDPAYSGVETRVPGWWRPIAAAGLVAVIVAVPGFSTVESQQAPEAPEEPAEATEVAPEPAPPVPPATVAVPAVAPDSTPAPAAEPTPVVAPVPPSEVSAETLVTPALAPVAAEVPSPEEMPRPALAPAPPESVEPATAPQSDSEPSVAPDVEVEVEAPAIERVHVSTRVAPDVEVKVAPKVVEHVHVSTKVAPKIASRVVIGSAPVKIATRLNERIVTRVEIEGGSQDEAAQVTQDEDDQDEWDDDWNDDWEDDWEDELEDDLDALEDEIDELMDEIEETLEEELELVADELEDELDALEDELEETIEAELELFEEGLESDLEAFEDEMEELEDRIEERLETVGWESREEAFERDIEQIEDSFDRLTDSLDDQMDRIEDQIERELERILEPLIDDRLEEQLEVLEERLDGQADHMEAMAERLAQQVRARGELRLSAEERAELMAEARRAAEQARPNPEEVAALRAELDRLSRAARPSREELDRIRMELREQLESLRSEARQGLEKQREDLAALRRKHKVL